MPASVAQADGRPDPWYPEPQPASPPERPLTETPPTALIRRDDVTVQVLEHRFIERVANGACAVSERLNLPFTRLDLDHILNAAKRKTGLSDWGDERFMVGLEETLKVVGETAYTPLARVFIANICIRAVVHRLRIEQWFKDHPDALDIPIEKPVFVLGFPRTGTTVMQNMLEQASHRRALQFWELTSPIPFHADLERDRRARIKRIESDLFWAYRFVPEMGEVHEVKATTAEECWPLLSNTFNVVNFDICHGLKPYGHWLMEQDMEWAYREYRRMLQMLLWRIPAQQLVLKCPEHLWAVDSLLKVFPDACIAWTHRAPFDCIASYSSMISLSRRTLQGKIVPADIGPHIADRFNTGVTRAMAARAAHGDESRFFDVPFSELIQDRVGMVHRIEEYFGLEQTDGTLLQGWLDQERADARGKHRYDPAMWGLTPDAINGQFADYIERFGIDVGGMDEGAP